MMKKRFRVIEGGLLSKEDCPKKFISAYITDTRLMGAMGMFIKWEVLDCSQCNEMTQFFYFDTEEFGLENYESIWGNDRKRIFAIEHSTVGCLGGKKVNLTEEEVCLLVQHFHNLNIKWKLPLPKDAKDYKFILEKEIPVTEKETFNLGLKLCTEIRSDYEAIHYCLMRMFGKDFQGSLYVCNENMHLEDMNIFPQVGMSTFFKNTITDFPGYFMCESLVCHNDQHYICTTKVITHRQRVSSLEPTGCFAISPQEAAFILSKTEYISVYNPVDSDFEHISTILELPFNTTCTHHPNGKMLMAFKPNNDHVNQNVFRLSEDIYGTFFITNTGQFVLAGYSLEDIHKLEDALHKSTVGKLLSPVGKFAFQDPILFDFVGTDLEDFIEFIDLMDL